MSREHQLKSQFLYLNIFHRAGKGIVRVQELKKSWTELDLKT